MITNIIVMDISIDKRKIDSIYIDKVNFHYATNNEIIKLVDNGNCNPQLAFIKLISASKNLKDEEANLLYMIYTNRDINDVYAIGDYYVKHSMKSVSTFYRSLHGLVKHEIIKINPNNTYYINSEYNLPNNISNAKFIIIELRPNEII